MHLHLSFHCTGAWNGLLGVTLAALRVTAGNRYERPNKKRAQHEEAVLFLLLLRASKDAE